MDQSNTMKFVMARAKAEAKHGGRSDISVEDLFLGILKISEIRAEDFLDGPEIYLKVADNFGVGRIEIFWKIIFPAAFSQIVSGVHLALGTAWVFLVCGEMVGAQSGLGYLIIDARNNLRNDILAADIAVIGLIGFLLNAGIELIEKRFLKRWGLA